VHHGHDLAKSVLDVLATAPFDIAVGNTVTYAIACEGDGSVEGVTSTSIFTPAT